MDGKLKSSLISIQQTRATNLGIGTNLPNAINAVLMQNGNTLGTVTGSNSKTISQANLPNINFPTAITSLNGDHSHTFTRPNGDQSYSNGSGNTWWGFTLYVFKRNSTLSFEDVQLKTCSNKKRVFETNRKLSCNGRLLLGSNHIYLSIDI